MLCPDRRTRAFNPLPLGGGVGRVFSVGAQPVNMTLQAYDNVITTEGGTDWQLRFQVQLLFPQ